LLWLKLAFLKIMKRIYPLHLNVQVSASRERVSYKTRIEENSCSIVEIHNAGDDLLSACP